MPEQKASPSCSDFSIPIFGWAAIYPANKFSGNLPLVSVVIWHAVCQNSSKVPLHSHTLKSLWKPHATDYEKRRVWAIQRFSTRHRLAIYAASPWVPLIIWRHSYRRSGCYRRNLPVLTLLAGEVIPLKRIPSWNHLACHAVFFDLNHLGWFFLLRIMLCYNIT